MEHRVHHPFFVLLRSPPECVRFSIRGCKLNPNIGIEIEKLLYLIGASQKFIN